MERVHSLAILSNGPEDPFDTHSASKSLHTSKLLDPTDTIPIIPTSVAAVHIKELPHHSAQQLFQNVSVRDRFRKHLHGVEHIRNVSQRHHSLLGACLYDAHFNDGRRLEAFQQEIGVRFSTMEIVHGIAEHVVNLFKRFREAISQVTLSACVWFLPEKNSLFQELDVYLQFLYHTFTETTSSAYGRLKKLLYAFVVKVRPFVAWVLRALPTAVVSTMTFLTELAGELESFSASWLQSGVLFSSVSTAYRKAIEYLRSSLAVIRTQQVVVTRWACEHVSHAFVEAYRYVSSPLFWGKGGVNGTSPLSAEHYVEPHGPLFRAVFEVVIRVQQMFALHGHCQYVTDVESVQNVTSGVARQLLTAFQNVCSALATEGANFRNQRLLLDHTEKFSFFQSLVARLPTDFQQPQNDEHLLLLCCKVLSSQFNSSMEQETIVVTSLLDNTCSTIGEALRLFAERYAIDLNPIGDAGSTAPQEAAAEIRRRDYEYLSKRFDAELQTMTAQEESTQQEQERSQQKQKQSESSVPESPQAKESSVDKVSSPSATSAVLAGAIDSTLMFASSASDTEKEQGTNGDRNTAAKQRNYTPSSEKLASIKGLYSLLQERIAEAREDCARLGEADPGVLTIIETAERAVQQLPAAIECLQENQEWGGLPSTQTQHEERVLALGQYTRALNLLCVDMLDYVCTPNVSVTDRRRSELTVFCAAVEKTSARIKWVGNAAMHVVQAALEQVQRAELAVTRMYACSDSQVSLEKRAELLENAFAMTRSELLQKATENSPTDTVSPANQQTSLAATSEEESIGVRHPNAHLRSSSSSALSMMRPSSEAMTLSPSNTASLVRFLRSANARGQLDEIRKFCMEIEKANALKNFSSKLLNASNRNSRSNDDTPWRFIPLDTKSFVLDAHARQNSSSQLSKAADITALHYERLLSAHILIETLLTTRLSVGVFDPSVSTALSSAAGSLTGQTRQHHQQQYILSSGGDSSGGIRPPLAALADATVETSSELSVSRVHSASAVVATAPTTSVVDRSRFAHHRGTVAGFSSGSDTGRRSRPNALVEISSDQSTFLQELLFLVSTLRAGEETQKNQEDKGLTSVFIDQHLLSIFRSTMAKMGFTALVSEGQIQQLERLLSQDVLEEGGAVKASTQLNEYEHRNTADSDSSEGKSRLERMAAVAGFDELGVDDVSEKRAEFVRQSDVEAVNELRYARWRIHIMKRVILLTENYIVRLRELATKTITIDLEQNSAVTVSVEQLIQALTATDIQHAFPILNDFRGRMQTFNEVEADLQTYHASLIQYEQLATEYAKRVHLQATVLDWRKVHRRAVGRCWWAMAGGVVVGMAGVEIFSGGWVKKFLEYLFPVALSSGVVVERTLRSAEVATRVEDFGTALKKHGQLPPNLEKEILEQGDYRNERLVREYLLGGLTIKHLSKVDRMCPPPTQDGPTFDLEHYCQATETAVQNDLYFWENASAVKELVSTRNALLRAMQTHSARAKSDVVLERTAALLCHAQPAGSHPKDWEASTRELFTSLLDESSRIARPALNHINEERAALGQAPATMADLTSAIKLFQARTRDGAEAVESVFTKEQLWNAWHRVRLEQDALIHDQVGGGSTTDQRSASFAFMQGMWNISSSVAEFGFRALVSMFKRVFNLLGGGVWSTSDLHDEMDRQALHGGSFLYRMLVLALSSSQIFVSFAAITMTFGVTAAFALYSGKLFASWCYTRMTRLHNDRFVERLRATVGVAESQNFRSFITKNDGGETAWRFMYRAIAASASMGGALATLAILRSAWEYGSYFMVVMVLGWAALKYFGVVNNSTSTLTDAKTFIRWIVTAPLALNDIEALATDVLDVQPYQAVRTRYRPEVPLAGAGSRTTGSTAATGQSSNNITVASVVSQAGESRRSALGTMISSTLASIAPSRELALLNLSNEDAVIDNLAIQIAAVQDYLSERNKGDLLSMLEFTEEEVTQLAAIRNVQMIARESREREIVRRLSREEAAANSIEQLRKTLRTLLMNTQKYRDSALKILDETNNDTRAMNTWIKVLEDEQAKEYHSSTSLIPMAAAVPSSHTKERRRRRRRVPDDHLEDSTHEPTPLPSSAAAATGSTSDTSSRRTEGLSSNQSGMLARAKARASSSYYK